MDEHELSSVEASRIPRPLCLIRQSLAVFVCLFLSSCSTLHLQDSATHSSASIDRILAIDPRTLSREQFYDYESAIVRGFSGSGGHFLEEPEIAWLRKAEVAFDAKGINLRDEYGRGLVIADSYVNARQYEKAFTEFKRLGSQYGIELTEWFIKNKGLSNAGAVSLVEYNGREPCSASETARVEAERYTFVAYFKGPVYRYDKRTRKHALIYMPKDKYDWCDQLAFNGKTLIIRLRDDAGMYAFNNERNELHSVCNVLRENNPFRDDVVLTSVK